MVSVLDFVFEKYFKGERVEKMSKQGNGSNFPYFLTEIVANKISLSIL